MGNTRTGMSFWHCEENTVAELERDNGSAAWRMCRLF